MANDSWQEENGSYTRISNVLLEALSRTPLLGAEMAICLFVIRKTYGFGKKQDQISITQFQEGIQRSRPTVVKALKNLQLVNILELVKSGNSKISSNVWALNKNLSEWRLVNTPELVKSDDTTSKVNTIQLVKTPLPTKETKENYNPPIAAPNGSGPTDELFPELPDSSHREKRDIRAESQEILQYLNEKAGTGFLEVETHLERICQRLKTSTVDECKAVIDHKCLEWRDDPKARVWLRPKTLFGKEQFETYRGQLPKKRQPAKLPAILSPPVPEKPATQDEIEAMITARNEWRQKCGLPPLGWDEPKQVGMTQ